MYLVYRTHSPLLIKVSTSDMGSGCIRDGRTPASWPACGFAMVRYHGDYFYVNHSQQPGFPVFTVREILYPMPVHNEGFFAVQHPPTA